MRFSNQAINSIYAFSLLGVSALLITACSGSGGGGGDVIPIVPIIPITPTTCLTNPDPNTQLPTQFLRTDQVFHNYVSPDSNYQIYGYKNPNLLNVKTIKIYNNYSNTIYPVIFSPTAFTGSDGQIKTLSRIFVGKPSCSDPASFFSGIPSGGNATVYVPKQMWNAGHVKIFTESPPFLQQDVNAPVVAPKFTIDTDMSSPNFGYMLYASGTPNDFPQELPFQLTEYTIESNCADDSPNCATPLSDKLTVDFDISAVDQLFLPLSMQESTGSRGFVGTGMKVEDFQVQILNFIKGAGAFAYDPIVGWPYYYGSAQAQGYKNNLIKIPMGYNAVNSILFPSPSPFNSAANSIFIFNKNTSQFVGDQATLQNVLNNIQPRWSNFWTPGSTICNGQAQPFCGNFIKTMNFLFNNIVNACQYSLSHTVPSIDPALCTTSRDGPPINPRSVLTDIDKIQKLLGYNFSGTTFDNPGGTYPASDPDNICTAQTGNPPKDGEFYSNCFRDAAKSAQRGVPYPFWLYPDQFYPDLSSIYTLNPAVWLVHKQLNLSEYAFSVDDDIGNQELVGNSISIAVGGLTGLKSTNAFDPKFLQILAFPGGTVNPQWQGTVSSSNVCIPGKVGACDLNIQPGGFTSVNVALTGISGVTNPNYFLNFTVTAGNPQSCTRTTPAYNYTPLVITNCSTTAGLKNCDPGLLSVTFSDPNSCAQTVSPSIPTT